MKKGDLPINTTVIIVLAIVVLLAVVAFFLGVIRPSGQAITAEAELQTQCNKFVAAGCPSIFFFQMSDSAWNTAKQRIGKDPTYSISTDEMKPVCNCP